MWVDFTYKKSSYDKDSMYISGTYFDKDSIIYSFDDFITKNEKKIKGELEKGYGFSSYMFSKREEAQKFADYLNELKKENK